MISQVPAALQGVPDPGDTYQSRLIHTRLPSYTPHFKQSTATLPVAQGMPIRLLGWPRTRSSFRQCLKELFELDAFRMDSLTQCEVKARQELPKAAARWRYLNGPVADVLESCVACQKEIIPGNQS
ncbi:hypothetical protein PoB_002051500 [Plakobranchus ocellatus]|uniref:Integrase zinc-binding domain-containing protein n=1 Tax=Plakobranchus ocellatus TaxID=259542 RepID=A0AAV3ZEH8_9GAST|nr:hypothetical protein PoB_002051500 [Plakobranchus ocellatus]